MTEPTSYRVDKSIKSDAHAIFAQLGLKPSQAINLFLRQVVLRGGIPFDLKTRQPNADTLAAMKELENSGDLKSYQSFEALRKDLDV